MANTASRNGKKTTTQRKKTNTSGRKKQPAKSKQPVKNKQIQDNQLRNDCIILFSIACAIRLILTNFNLAGTLGRGIKWFMFGVWRDGIHFSICTCSKCYFLNGKQGFNKSCKN